MNFLMNSRNMIGQLTIGLALLFSLTYAQPANQQQDRTKFHQEFHTYVQTNIHPVLQSQRASLDQSLSLEAQQEITEIRKGLKDLRDQMKDARPGRMGKKHGSDAIRETPSPEQIELRRSHMKVRRQLMTRAWAVADRYEDEIYQLQDELAPQLQIWREDLQSLKNTYQPEERGSHHSPKPERPRQGIAEQGLHKSHKGHRRPGHHKMRFLQVAHSPVSFLLWDPSEPMPERNHFSETNSLSVFPNPSPGNSTLSFEMEKAGSAVIELLDPQGNLEKSWTLRDLRAGTHRTRIETTSLESGLYVIRILIGEEVKTTKMLVK